ncbi:MAG: hypothetical protein JW987_00760 [Anaerolineaceae bacterium]|nr:hypothetical protein [Anaerolineaceae bacterium]
MEEPFVPRLDFARLYRRFDAPIAELDCGQMCAPHNSSGKPFCCDICYAVPAAYRPEWTYLRGNTDLWKEWRGDECPGEPFDPAEVWAETPEHMLLLACKGPAHCQRDFRSVSCRQFPFFPYITADSRFLGLVYEWAFEEVCWVISHQETVTQRYRSEFVRFYDEVLAQWPDDFECYADHAEEMREEFAARKQRIPLLHRNGGFYLISPQSERLERVAPERFKRFGPYR